MKKKRRIYEVTAHGVTLKVYRSKDKPIKSWAKGEIYEKFVLDRIHALGLKGMAIDAGAHAGNHTLFLAGVCGLEVVAFEPIHWWALARNVDLNGLQDRVRIEPHGLGEVHAHRAQAVPTPDSVSLWEVDDSEPGTLSVVPLDALNLRPQLVKVDVAGMEVPLLRGAHDTIERSRPVMFIECHGERVAEVERIMLGHGYTLENAYRVKSPNPMLEWHP